jgi:hypothetical protein
MLNISCKTCTAYDPLPNAANRGLCRRNAPQSTLVPIQGLDGKPTLTVQSWFPDTPAEGWCLKHSGVTAMATNDSAGSS